MEYVKQISKVIETDVLVIGGGPAGFGTAVAAARNGAKTIIVERAGVLGGMATTSCVGPFMCCYDNDGEEQIVMGIFDELCRRTEAKGGALHPSKAECFNLTTSFYKRGHHNTTPFLSPFIARTMDEMVQEAGVKVMFFTQFVDALTSNGKITSVIVATKEGLMAIKAKNYVDCSGDADVAAAAGVETWIGDKETGKCQPVTLEFDVDHIDRDVYAKELIERKDELDNNFKNCYNWIVDKARANGDWTISRNEIGAYETNIPGRFKINTTRINNVDALSVDAVSEAMIESRRQVEEVYNFMKKYLPGCENAQICEVGTYLGVRESRHIVGRYEITLDDIMHRTHFEDAILTYGYSVDLHAYNDGGGVFETVDKYYTIPYRAMVPIGCDNLMVAGRTICGSSMAAASYRVMPCCIAMGQAVGTAAALVNNTDTNIGDIDIKLLQKTLIEQGAVIKGIQENLS